MLHNIEAEQYLLGCLFIEQDLIKEIILKPEHFYLEKHQFIFQAMKDAETRGEPTDIVTVYSLIPKDKREEIGAEYLNQLASAIPTVENYKVYEKLILDCWKMRRAQALAKKLIYDLETAPDTSVISHITQNLLRLEEIGYESDFDLKRTLAEIYDELGKETKGIETGFYDLDAFTNGWRDGDLIIIGARPSIGKTALALNFGANACKNGVVVSIFSLEMSKKSLLKRMIAAEGRIDATKLRNPKQFFQAEEWEKTIDTIGFLEKLPLYIYDNPSISVPEIRAKVRHLKRKYPDRKHLCIIDYLQLIRGEKAENRNLEIGAISRELKIMAREYNLPVIVLSQLSRSVEHRKDKRPMLSDLRESGNVEQDADVALLLYRDDYYDPETQDKNIIEVIIAKQRDGPTGKVKLAYLKEYNRFMNLAR